MADAPLSYSEQRFLCSSQTLCGRTKNTLQFQVITFCNKQTGEFIPSKRLNPEQAAVRDPAVTATAKIVGPAMVLDAVSKELGLEKVLKSCFSKLYRQVLCMAYYLAVRGGPLSHCEARSKSHSNPYDAILTSQRISEILRSLDDDERQTFFARWTKKVVENDYLCVYDITSVSSYGELNEYVKYGYNRDREKLKQINLAFTVLLPWMVDSLFSSLP